MDPWSGDSRSVHPQSGTPQSKSGRQVLAKVLASSLGVKSQRRVLASSPGIKFWASSLGVKSQLRGPLLGPPVWYGTPQSKSWHQALVSSPGIKQALTLRPGIKQALTLRPGIKSWSLFVQLYSTWGQPKRIVCKRRTNFFPPVISKSICPLAVVG